MAVGGNYRVFASHDFGSWSLEDAEKIGVAIKGSCDFSPGFVLGVATQKIKGSLHIFEDCNHKAPK